MSVGEVTSDERRRSLSKRGPLFRVQANEQAQREKWGTWRPARWAISFTARERKLRASAACDRRSPIDNRDMNATGHSMTSPRGKRQVSQHPRKVEQAQPEKEKASAA